MAEPKLSAETASLLRCPACGSRLDRRELAFECASPPCGRSYPDAPGGIPILIDEEQSVFRHEQFLGNEATFFRRHAGIRRFLRSLVPDPGENRKAPANFARMRELLLDGREHARVLVLGGSVLGAGVEHLLDPRIELVESDVSIGPRSTIICDAHSIPFADASFDGVVSQAVLEHVADPIRCVAEITRVLRPDAVLYAETPFMQQVHGGAYDFTRFSLLGHRRLFRSFSEIASGAVSGPATAMAWSWEYLLVALVPWKGMRGVMRAFARLTSALPLRMLDRIIVDRDAALDGASGFYFLGRKSDRSITDRELIGLYRGAL
jgi:SAM-dependent methyltransferase